MNQLDKLLEKTKIKAFLCKDAALLGTLLARVSFSWNEKINKARISAKHLEWNPDWFQELTEDSRVTVLLHELWHLARLHSLRVGTRDKKLWNAACDFRINNDLLADGYKFTNAGGLLDPSLDFEGRLSEEEIYDLLKDNPNSIPPSYDPDLEPVSSGSTEEQELLQSVQLAQKYAASCDNGVADELEQILAQNLKSKVPWQRLLRQYFTEVSSEDYSWKRPNRRYSDVYLPSLMPASESLTSLNYYIDTSGSISTDMLIRFNAELRNIWQDLKPELLRVINFDTKIQSVREITQNEPFDYINFKGRGGTSLYPVFKHMEETKPYASIIFSDLYCEMPKKQPKCPVIWIIIDNPSVKPPFGKFIHIPKESLTHGH